MKEKIKIDNMKKYERNKLIFWGLFASMILSIIPLVLLCGNVGIGFWALIFVVTLFFGFKLGKLKRCFDDRNCKKRLFRERLLIIGMGLLMAAVLIIVFNFFGS